MIYIMSTVLNCYQIIYDGKMSGKDIFSASQIFSDLFDPKCT